MFARRPPQLFQSIPAHPLLPIQQMLQIMGRAVRVKGTGGVSHWREDSTQVLRHMTTQELPYPNVRNICVILTVFSTYWQPGYFLETTGGKSKI